jgi:hypothetical protein
VYIHSTKFYPFQGSARSLARDAFYIVNTVPASGGASASGQGGSDRLDHLDHL